MKYFLVVGEASGDLHASNLMRSLKEVDPEADFCFQGGDLMQSVGGTMIRHYREVAFMGFIPVLMHLRTIFKQIDACKKAIEAYQPDKVILVDYPDFNLKIAKYLKQSCSQKPVVIYYISPKIWAWKEYRIHDIKRYIDKMYCILPFEVAYYKKHHYKVEYMGNPTVDALAERACKDETFAAFTHDNQLESKPIIALLAGSRKQEIHANLPTMLEASVPFKEYQIVIAGAPGIDPSYYTKFVEGRKIHIVFGQTYRLLQQSKAALVTSGTATLETALLQVPQAVCYELPLKRLSSFIFEKMFSCRYISLVNLIADRSIVKELYGKHFSTKQIREELDRLLHDNAYRQKMSAGYQEIIDCLGQPGASGKLAERIYRI